MACVWWTGVEGGDASLENFEWYQKLFNYGQGQGLGLERDGSSFPVPIENVDHCVLTTGCLCGDAGLSSGEDDPDERLVPQVVHLLPSKYT